MSRVTHCSRCGKPDLCGYVPCLDHEICPACAATYFSAPLQVVAEELVKHSGLDLEEISAQIAELEEGRTKH